jgi:hypothetical protein
MADDAKGDGPVADTLGPRKPVDSIEWARAVVAEFDGPAGFAKLVAASYRDARPADRAKLMANCVALLTEAVAALKTPGA